MTASSPKPFGRFDYVIVGAGSAVSQRDDPKCSPICTLEHEPALS